MNLQAGSSFDFGESNSAGVRYEFSRTPSSKYNADSNIKTNADGQESSIASANELLSQSMQRYLNGYATIKFGAKRTLRLRLTPTTCTEKAKTIRTPQRTVRGYTAL